MRDIKDIAKDIVDDLLEFGGEQSEVLGELVEIAMREEELTGRQRDELIEALENLGVC